MSFDSREQATLQRAAALAIQFLDSLDTAPVGTTT